MSLRAGFRKPFNLCRFCSKAAIILVLFLHVFVSYNLPEKIRDTREDPIFPFPLCRITLTFPSILKTFLLFVTVAVLLLYQSAVNYNGRDAERNFSTK